MHVFVKQNKNRLGIFLRISVNLKVLRDFPARRNISALFLQILASTVRAKKALFIFDFFHENNPAIKLFCKNQEGKGFLKARDRGLSVVNTCRVRNHMASAKSKICHLFGNTFSCLAAPPVFVKLSEFQMYDHHG